MAFLKEKGFDVYPAYGNSRADFVYTEETGQAVRAQVKTATRCQSGVYTYEQVRLSGKTQYKRKDGTKWKAPNYTENEIDEMWIVGTHIWCFPISDIIGLTSLALLSDGPQIRNKAYDPEKHVEFTGTWKNPVRSIFSVDTR